MRKAIVILVMIVGLQCVGAVKVTSRLDTVTMMMGEMNALRVQVVASKNAKGYFPLLRDAEKDGIATMLGDTIELRIGGPVDTIELGSGRVQYDYRIPLQCFNPGVYTIPALAYVSGQDTSWSNTAVLRVNAPDVTANDTISPDVPPVGPYYNRNFEKYTDRIPDIIYYYWWAWLAGIAGICVAIWYLKNHKVKLPAVISSSKPEESPYDVAIRSLKKLKDAKLWENGQEQLYYTRLTEILRKYLEGRFHINAMEMTTSEIKDAVRSSEDASQYKAYINEVLGVADYVKFAKMRPLPDDNVEAFENAMQFILHTKPQPAVEDDKAENASKNAVATNVIVQSAAEKKQRGGER